MPADRPRIMLFSPIKGKKCNTKMYIVYVWKETKKPKYRLTAKNPQGLILWHAQQHFLKGTEFLRFLLMSAEAAPCVPGSGLQGLLVAGASISINPPQFPQETSLSAMEYEVILFSACAMQGTPSRVCQSHHPVLSYAGGRRAGGGVIWQLLCTRDLSWQTHFFPCVFIYIFLSSNCTRH